MLDKLWLILIIFIIILGITLNKKINYNNYKINKLLKKINKDNLFLSLGTKMGVGSFLGITMSIYIGGPGSLFWIYFFTILTSSITYIESLLGSKYKQKLNNSYVSGIYYYTKYGLKKNKLALFMLLLFVSTYSFFFLMIQTNTISNILNVNKLTLSTIVLILLILLVTNDINEIRKLLNKIVPFISLFFITISIYVISKNINILTTIFINILKNAFTKKSMFTGIIIGIKRSIFLNELLIGTTSMSSGINNEKSEVSASTLVISSYFLVFVISTFIALLILIYLYYNNTLTESYMKLLINSFNFHFNTYGSYFLSLIICTLSTSTIISGTYIGISNLSYIIKNKTIINIFKILLILFIICGIFINTTLIWKIIDLFMFLLIGFNIYIIYKLEVNK